MKTFFFRDEGYKVPRSPGSCMKKDEGEGLTGRVMEVTTIYDLIPIGMTGTVPNIFYSFSRLPMPP